MSLVRESIACSLAAMDVNSEFKEPMLELFRKINDIQIKSDLLGYFIRREITDIESELNDLSEKEGHTKIISPYNCIHYNKEQIQVIPNIAPYIFSKSAKRYFDMIKRTKNGQD
jgi:hypothetical protein